MGKFKLHSVLFVSALLLSQDTAARATQTTATFHFSSNDWLVGLLCFFILIIFVMTDILIKIIKYQRLSAAHRLAPSARRTLAAAGATLSMVPPMTHMDTSMLSPGITDSQMIGIVLSILIGISLIITVLMARWICLFTGMCFR
jgi:hypothetical protein